MSTHRSSWRGPTGKDSSQVDCQSNQSMEGDQGHDKIDGCGDKRKESAGFH